MNMKLSALLMSILLGLTCMTGTVYAQTPGAETVMETQEEAKPLFTERDLSGTYDGDKAILLSLDNGPVTITEKGIYVLSGMLTGGSVCVEADEKAKVQLVLDGAEIDCSGTAAILVRNADKVFVTLKDGTENRICVQGDYTGDEDLKIDAAVFSTCDLTLNGSGSLYVSAEYGHGIVSKKDLVITGGTYAVTCEKNAFDGKKSLSVCCADVTAVAGGGSAGAEMKASDTFGGGFRGMQGSPDRQQMTGRGNLGPGTGNNGTDGMTGSTASVPGGFGQGENRFPTGGIPDNGPAFPQTGDSFPAAGPQPQETGNESRTQRDGGWIGPDGGFTDPQGKMPFGNGQQDTQSSQTVSTGSEGKAFHSEGTVTIVSGTYDLDTRGDAIHCLTVRILDGTFRIRSGDDAIHADGAVMIENGSFEIPYCYEGVEGQSITVLNGSFTITSHDDGFNAASGSSGKTQIPGVSSEENFILLDDGIYVMVCGGDCIDSNGSITINGGSYDLTSNGPADTCLDTDGEKKINGGTFRTNDGSESTSGSFGPMRGRGF